MSNNCLTYFLFITFPSISIICMIFSCGTLFPNTWWMFSWNFLCNLIMFSVVCTLYQSLILSFGQMWCLSNRFFLSKMAFISGVYINKACSSSSWLSTTTPYSCNNKSTNSFFTYSILFQELNAGFIMFSILSRNCLTSILFFWSIFQTKIKGA